MLTKVIIPVAGLGTRVLPASKAIPKEMLPVVDKPVIQHVVEEAMRAGERGREGERDVKRDECVVCMCRVRGPCRARLVEASRRRGEGREATCFERARGAWI